MPEQTKPRIGFVGVGLMGHGMAKHILKHGYATTIHAHRKRESIDDLVRSGATETTQLAQLARTSDIVLLCVSNSDVVDDVIFGSEGLLAGAQPGLVFVDTGTSRPDRTCQVNDRLRTAGMLFADAPLSRSPAKAEEGQLVSLTSCEMELFARIKPVLDTYSEVVLHVGEQVGKAHQLKLINNFIAGAYTCAWAEAYNACLAAGIEPEHLHAVVSAAGMDCLNFQNYSKFVLANDTGGHKFAVENLHKDMRYYQHFAQEEGIMTTMVDPILQLLTLAVQRGYGKDYVPVMPKVVGEINNKPAGDLPRGRLV